MATNETAIAVINEYPPAKFNLLVPVKTLQRLSPLHKIVMNVVQVSPEPAAGDSYKERNGEFAFTKTGLAKFMAASNTQIVDSQPVLPQKCQRCAEVARQSRRALRCGECPNADDVARQVTIAVPEPSGTWRLVRATKEIRMEDERKRMTDKQFEQFFPYRTEHCETKALNRALREGLMLKPTYRAEELQKPFVVAYVVPDMTHPDMRRAAAARFLGSVSDLFGKPGEALQISGPTEVIERDVTVIPVDEPEDGSSASGQPTAVATPAGDLGTPPWEQADQGAQAEQNPSPPSIDCEGCGFALEQHGNWTPQNIRDYSMQRFGRILCPECQKKARAAKAGGQR